MPDLFNTQPEVSLVASLAFDSPLDQLFDYQVPPDLADSLHIGQRVQAPFGRANRPKIGFCLQLAQQAPSRPLKIIRKIIDPKPLIVPNLLDLAHWISSYYCSPLGTVLAAMIPGPVKQQPTIKTPRLFRLTDLGRTALDPSSATKLGPRQRAVLQALLSPTDTKPTPIPAQLLRQRAQASAQTLRTLIQKKYISQLDADQAQAYLDQAQPPPTENLTQPDWLPNADQQRALHLLNPVLTDPTFSVHLLHGVTSSGKTEIYIHCLQHLIQSGKQAIVLVPEIALTTQTLERFRTRLPGICVLHSGLTSAQRRREWLRIASGQGHIVVGPRSAIFAPTAKLGLIIVDEEHEPSYKQDTQPRYHGRDVAIKRAQLLNIPIILGSATPSLESLHNSRTLPHFSRIHLPSRVHNLPLPPVQLVDLRQEYRDRKGLHLLSRTLESKLRQTLDQGQQAILLLNRRGYAGFVSCPSCNYVLTCEHCDVTLTYHRRTDGPIKTPRALCHYCLSESRVPKSCPTCGQRLVFLGSGTQRAEQELTRKFPQARFARVDSDTMNRHKYQDLLQRFGTRQLDILLGTQMIAKGLDFPNVHLVGILSADTALSIPDFRSSERTFQLAAQVAGRAGRATPGASVILQTLNPEFPAIHFATTHDYEGFADAELALRKSLNYPPFGRMARIILRSPSLHILQTQARRAAHIIAQAIASTAQPVTTTEPLPPPIARISGHHRLHFILRAPTAGTLHSVLTQARSELFKLTVYLAIDMDPVNLL